jgi:hypothetical protein
MSLRTLPVQSAELPRAIELQGLVVMDPNAGGQVQATQAGRLVPPPQGFPSLGQRVQRGQLLAYVEPVTGALERSAQTAQIAELRSAQELAQKRLARLRELADTVPRREIEATESNPANQTIVWVKESPERFAPRVVTAVPLDGTSVAVTSGLKPGDRVTTQGATLINQVR